MRVSNINLFNTSKVTKPNFKAEVVVLPFEPKHPGQKQPTEDSIVINNEVKRVKAELEERFPDKNDNLFIELLPTGFKTPSFYWNQIIAKVSYKDIEKAREDIIKENNMPQHEDYIKLKPETIEKLKNRDPLMMERLGDLDLHYSETSQKEYLGSALKNFSKYVEEDIKMEMGYVLLEDPDVPPPPPWTSDGSGGGGRPSWDYGFIY